MSCCRDGFVPYCDARFEICDAEITLGGMFECFLGGRKLVVWKVMPRCMCSCGERWEPGGNVNEKVLSCQLGKRKRLLFELLLVLNYVISRQKARKTCSVVWSVTWSRCTGTGTLHRAQGTGELRPGGSNVLLLKLGKRSGGSESRFIGFAKDKMNFNTSLWKMKR